MASFDPTTLKSVTIEDALLELSEKIALLESDVSSNPSAIDNMAVSYSAQNVVNISFSGTVNKTIDSTGKIEISVKEYLT